MNKRFWLSLLALTLLLLPLSAASAQDNYHFALVEETVHAYWQNDGSLTLSYTFVFQNAPDGHPIDYVDVGMPTYWFYESNAQATVNGQPVPVSEAEYAGDGYGLAVVLGNYAIPPGKRGTVTLRVTDIEQVLYSDSDDDTYASAVFSPTWFGKQYLYGNTTLTVVYHLPPGVQPEEPRYHLPSKNWPGAETPEIGYDSNHRITYTWYSDQANGYTQYKFGASFPQRYVPAQAISSPTIWQKFGIDPEAALGMLVFGVVTLSIAGLIAFSAWANKRRRLQYVPPEIGIEGHGIKRGLTAVEAALLMGEPLDKVLTMILFSVIKKGAAEVLEREPLRLKIADPLPQGLRPYEKLFLEAMQETDLGKRSKLLRSMIAGQIKVVQEKMRGFSRKETIRYYRKITERAWQHVQLAETPEMKADKFGEYAEWTLLDKDFDDQARRAFDGGTVYAPVWWGRFDPGLRGAGTSGRGRSASAPSSSGTRVAIPGAAFAESLVGSINQVASETVGDIKQFTAGVTERTNPVHISSSSGRSGGGGGCACACACAGCACACAGGGR